MTQSMDTRRSGNIGSLESLIVTPLVTAEKPAAEEPIVLAQAEQSPTRSGKKQPPKFLQKIGNGVGNFMEGKVRPVVEKGVSTISGEKPTEQKTASNTRTETTTATNESSQQAQAEAAPETKKKKGFFKTVGNIAKGAAQVVGGVGGEVLNVAGGATGITNGHGIGGGGGGGAGVIGQLAMAFAPGELRQAISLLQEASAWNKMLNDVYGKNAEVPEQPVIVEIGQVDTEGKPVYDKNGKPVMVEYSTAGRELRDIRDQQYQQQTEKLLKSEEGRELLGGDKDVSAEIKKVRTTNTPNSNWCREHKGEAAEQVRRECMALVKMKGGAWNEAKEGQPAVNAVAIRGRDFSQGLKGHNGSKTFDDTIFVVKDELVNGKTQTTVREFRATTESSSNQEGVAKILAKQYVFNESSFKGGNEPCYRVKGNFAECTRKGQEDQGVQQAGGILIHQGWVSAKNVTSETPLASNVSLGCQALACQREQFVQDFMGFIKPAKSLTYTVADCNEAKLIVDSRRDASGNSLSALA